MPNPHWENVQDELASGDASLSGHDPQEDMRYSYSAAMFHLARAQVEATLYLADMVERVADNLEEK
ncbi:MAG: hypothetical protein ACYSWP_12830 [Planctomycetota bacterium]|jgi:hypothetical protein